MTPKLASPLPGVLTLSLLTFSCVTTQLPPISSAGGGFEPLKDEAKIWGQSREEERQLLDEAPIYDDPALAEYLEGVVARLTPPAMAANGGFGYQVRVIEDPTLNAFSYPHGAIYLHTGLLARMENESQLATVLAHEMTHIDNRHAVRHRRSAHNREMRKVGFGIAALTALILLDEMQDDAVRDGDYDKEFLCVFGEILVDLGLQLTFQASVDGYGYDFEREADFGSFAKLESAGYDLNESPKLFELLQDGRGAAGGLESYFFGNFSKLNLRVKNAREHLAKRPRATSDSEGVSEASPTFERRVQPVLKIDARENIAIGRFELAARELERALAMQPADGETHLLVGQLKLAQIDEAQDLAEAKQLDREAAESLRASVRLAPRLPEAHRELGLFAYWAEDFATACGELSTYLALAPDEQDAQAAREHLNELERAWHCASW